MDTLAFWLPLALLFLSALIGAVVKRRSCDHCLKKFEGDDTLLPISPDEWRHGSLFVFAQGVELKLVEPTPVMEDGLVDTMILHAAELEKVPYVARRAPAPDTRAGVEWKKARERLLHPPMRDRLKRTALNSYNMLRDSFGQAMKAILGSMSKNSKLAQAKDSDKRLHEMQNSFTELVPNAWEPILEKYRGKQVAVERKVDSGVVCETGILEDYSNKYLLLRDVKVTDKVMRERLLELGGSDLDCYDLLYSRTDTRLRYSMKSG